MPQRHGRHYHAGGGGAPAPSATLSSEDGPNDWSWGLQQYAGSGPAHCSKHHGAWAYGYKSGGKGEQLLDSWLEGRACNLLGSDDVKEIPPRTGVRWHHHHSLRLGTVCHHASEKDFFFVWEGNWMSYFMDDNLDYCSPWKHILKCLGFPYCHNNSQVVNVLLCLSPNGCCGIDTLDLRKKYTQMLKSAPSLVELLPLRLVFLLQLYFVSLY